MSSIRAFLAVNLPIRLVEEVRETQDKLRVAAKEASMKVSWVPPPNMHVTLKFLADIQEEVAWAIRELLLPKLEDRPPIQLSVKGTGVFPSRKRPRVIWVGVQSDGALESLAGDLDQWVHELGFVQETRPYHAHLTLGRVKNGAADLIEGLEEVAYGDCTIHEVVLYKSVLQRTGAEYTPLARFPLAGVAQPVERGADVDDASNAEQESS